MYRILSTALLLTGLTLAQHAAGAADKDDAKQIVGTWSLAAGTKAGREAPAKDARSVTITMTHDTLTFTRPDHAESLKWSIDPTTSPRQITLTTADGAPRPGIYELTPDQLKLCISGTDARPQDFTAPDGSRTVLMILTRTKD